MIFYRIADESGEGRTKQHLNTSFEKKPVFLRGRVVCSDEGQTLETSSKHHIPQATNIPYQPLLIKPIKKHLSSWEGRFIVVVAVLVIVIKIFLKVKTQTFSTKCHLQVYEGGKSSHAVIYISQ